MSNNNVEGAYLRKQIKDSQVFSVIGLDPFLKLPLDISARDQQLLQFHLTEGRILQRGSKTEPKYCPVLELCRAALRTSKTLVLVCITTAELVLSVVTKQDHPPNFAQRCSLTRSVLQKELRGTNVNRFDQVFCLLHMIFLEGILGALGGCGRYVEHLDDLMEASGGTGAFLATTANSTSYAIQTRYVSSMYLVTRLSIKNEEEFIRARTNFITSLRQIKSWCFSTWKTTNLDFNENRHKLWHLCTHLSLLIDTHLLSPNDSFISASGAFYCCYDIALTLTQYNFSHDQTLTYLLEVQKHIVTTNTRSGNATNVLQPLRLLGNAHDLASIRDDMDGILQYDRDSAAGPQSMPVYEVSQKLVDGQKLFALMPDHVRSKLTRMLCQAAICITDEIHPDLLDEVSLELIDRELIKAWYGRPSFSYSYSESPEE